MTANVPSDKPRKRLGMTEHELLNQIQGDQHALDCMKDAYLECAGWKHTCQTPGSIWMWERVIDSVTYRIGRDSALRMSEHLNPPPESDDDEG